MNKLPSVPAVVAASCTALLLPCAAALADTVGAAHGAVPLAEGAMGGALRGALIGAAVGGLVGGLAWAMKKNNNNKP